MEVPRNLTKEDYDSFIETFSKAFHKEFPNDCFYIYGSYLQSHFVPGVSDIDGGIILNCKTILDKEKVRKISHLLAEAKNAPIAIEFNLMDTGTNSDARFMAYEANYISWFQQGKYKVVCGPDYIKDIKGIDRKNDELRATAYGLRSMRNRLLRAHESRNKKWGEEGNLRGLLGEVMGRLVALPKRLLLFQKGEMQASKITSQETLEKVLPEFSSPLLAKAIATRSNQDEFKKAIFNPDIEEVLQQAEDYLTACEEIVAEFIKRYPRTKENE